MKIVVPTYSKTYWCLKPFTYLFNKYWEREEAVILHYPEIPFELPGNFLKYQVYYQDVEKNKWADGIISYLKTINDKSVIIMLEDYWLTRKVNRDAVNILNTLIENNDSILRIDLTADRLYAGGMRDVGYVEWIDLVEAPKSPYQMSLQAGIWNREYFIEIVEKLPENRRSGWDIELVGNNIFENETEYRVFGTRQFPVRYENGMNVVTGANKELKTMTKIDKDFIMKWLEDTNGN